MLKEIIISFRSFFHAHQLIGKHRLWKWIIIPGIFYSLLAFLGFVFFWKSSNNATAWILTKAGIKPWLDQLQDGWVSFLFITGQIFLHLLLILFYFTYIKYLFLIVAAPIFSYLSEKTNTLIKNDAFLFSKKELFQDTIRGSRVALKNLFWQTIYMVAIFIICLIPIVGWLAPLLFFFMECYYVGFSMMDYGYQRKQINTAKSRYIIGHHKGLAIGNGICFYVLHVIPILGWIIAPSYAIVASSLSIHEAEKNNIIIS